jgi:transcriptional regulator with XRE-family HTH domain
MARAGKGAAIFRVGMARARLGSEIRDARRKRRLTLTEVAGIMRWSTGFQYQIERASAGALPGRIRELADALGAGDRAEKWAAFAQQGRFTNNPLEARGFPAKLRDLRVSKGMTRAELGERMGWGATYVYGFETGRSRAPRAEIVQRLSEVLGAPDELPELMRLAMASRSTLTLKPALRTPPEVVEIVALIASEFSAGRIDVEKARQLRRVLAEESGTGPILER